MVTDPNLNGLLGEYFNDTELAQRVFWRIDGAINFPWKYTSPEPGVVLIDNFSVRWTGWIHASHGELYTFTALTDDGVRLWIDGKQIINAWDKSGDPQRGSVSLPANALVPFRMEYFDRALTATAQLSWQSKTQGLEIVPSDRFFQP